MNNENSVSHRPAAAERGYRRADRRDADRMALIMDMKWYAAHAESDAEQARINFRVQQLLTGSAEDGDA